jgi:hypothetical protein
MGGKNEVATGAVIKWNHSLQGSYREQLDVAEISIGRIVRAPPIVLGNDRYEIGLRGGNEYSRCSTQDQALRPLMMRRGRPTKRKLIGKPLFRISSAGNTRGCPSRHVPSWNVLSDWQSYQPRGNHPMLPVRSVLLTISLLVSAAALSQSEPVRAQPGSSASGQSSITFAARAAVRGPRGGAVVRGPRGVAVRGPHGGVAARGYRVGGRYYGGTWYGTGRRYWRGRWWPYGVGSCWRPSPIGYVWICG